MLLDTSVTDKERILTKVVINFFHSLFLIFQGIIYFMKFCIAMFNVPFFVYKWKHLLKTKAFCFYISPKAFNFVLVLSIEQVFSCIKMKQTWKMPKILICVWHTVLSQMIENHFAKLVNFPSTQNFRSNHEYLIIINLIVFFLSICLNLVCLWYRNNISPILGVVTCIVMWVKDLKCNMIFLFQGW